MASQNDFRLLPALRVVFRTDTRFLWTALVLGIAVSVLSLAVPIAVQLLIDSVANTGSVQAVVVVSLVLFVCLAVSGTLVATQNFVLEYLERRIFTRTVNEVTLRTLHADPLRLERRNRDDLYNYFFAIDPIKTHVPILLSTGLNLVLQAIVGYVLVSFYHPYFLLVSVVHAALVLLIWQSVDRGAVRTIIELSAQKYATGGWLEALASQRRLFLTGRSMGWAVDRSNRFAHRFLDAHKAHFRRSFTQTVGYQVLMAVGASLLLGIGGWLVIIGQLTLGQLVAAELILGTILLNMGAFSTLLESYYAVCAALDKLVTLYGLDLEPAPDRSRQPVPDGPLEVSLEDVVVTARRRRYALDMHLPAGSTVLMAPESTGLAEAFRDLLHGLQHPEAGRVRIAGRDIDTWDPVDLRGRIAVISDPFLLPCRIGDYMRIDAPDLTRGEIGHYLELLGLDALIEALPDGLDTELTPEGSPLTTTEALRLKLARALAQQPSVLVLGPVGDQLRLRTRRALLAWARDRKDTSLVMLSHRFDLGDFDHYVQLASGATRTLPDLAALAAAEHDADAERVEAGAGEREVDA